MNIWSTRHKIVVTCLKRLSPFVEEELKALGFPIARVFGNGVETAGTLTDCLRLNLELRCASQVLYSIRSFKAEHPGQVYDQVKGLPWEELLAPSTYLTVTGSVTHPTVNNSMFINMKVKDAVVDRLRAKTGQRPDSGPELKGAVVNLYWKEDEAEVFIDTSGETLAKHGYRLHPGRAPMMEALASATLMAAQWKGDTPFVNPMCGSGTLAIEAALIASRRAPGLYRDRYAFMHIKDYREADYREARERITAQVLTSFDHRIIASDISEGSVKQARFNAKQAGVEKFIEFHVCDFADTPLPQPPGVIFFNPEYGERMGELQELEKTYERLGDYMKQKCAGYTGYVFTGNLELAKKIGLKPKRRFEFFSAKIDCRLLMYELYAGTRRTEPGGLPLV
ncbi:MAG: class I SAM-dependent RNA methyltransferase [Cyclobacteriaceae bacterium]